jgi:hypothetical protein
MSYKVIEKDGKFDILEKDTETVIELKTHQTRAKELCRKMNLGSGFSGWTPFFFAISYPQK